MKQKKQKANTLQTETNHYTVNDHFYSLLSILVMMMLAGMNTVIASEKYQDISEQRRAELSNLLIQDCGSCHGMTMKGGLGPALTPEVLKTKSREMIEVTILQGRPGTPMPPWQSILSKEEVRWIVERLYSGVKQ